MIQENNVEINNEIFNKGTNCGTIRISTSYQQ